MVKAIGVPEASVHAGFSKIEIGQLLLGLRMPCITPCGLWQRGLGRSAALLFLPIAGLLAAMRRLAPHPDPHYHRLARVMQGIPSPAKGLRILQKLFSLGPIFAFGAPSPADSRESTQLRRGATLW